MEEIDRLTQLQTADRERGRATWLTVERAAYAAVGILAAVLRLAHLGLRPLTDGEALQALAAYRFTLGGLEAAPAGTVPALFTGNALAFTLFGDGDGLARWLPALAGIVLVLLPYWLRHRLGRGGALAAAAILAISPTAVFFSRAVDGAVIVAAAGLAVAVGLVNYVDTHRPGYLYVAAGALGLGLCAGPGMVTMVLILALYVLWLYVAGRAAGWAAVQEAWQAARAEPGLPSRLGLILAAVVGLVATTLVLHPAGIGLAADLLGSWLRGLAPEPGGQPFYYPLLLMARYELLAVALGAAEAVRRLVRRRGESEPGAGPSHTGLLAFWAALAAVVVVAAGQRLPGDLLLVVVPLALLAGQGLERAWHWAGRRVSWADTALAAGATLALVVFLYLQLAGYSLQVSGATVTVLGMTLRIAAGHLILALVSLVLLAGLAAVVWYMRGRAVVGAAAALVLVMVLAGFGFRGMWSASFFLPADAREVINLHPTAPDVRRLEDEVHTLSQTRLGDTRALSVTIESDVGPAVLWYLRDLPRQTVVDEVTGPTLPPGQHAIVTLAGQDLAIGENWRGESLTVRTDWQVWSLNPQAVVRWLMFSEAYDPAVDRQVVLWVQGSE